MSEENTTQPIEETVEETEPTAEPTPEPEPVTAVEKGTECGHPGNTTGYHHKGGDGTCIFCGH